MKHSVLFLLCLVFWANRAVGQPTVQGQVVSARTGEGVPFVAVQVENQQTGTLTDSVGTFRLRVPADTCFLLIRAMGFASGRVRADSASRIVLTESALNLTEISIKVINPAHRIINEAVRNLVANDPNQIAAFQYEAYHVSTVSRVVPAIRKTVKNDSAAGNTSVGKDLYVNESYSVRQFMAPNLSRETITASRTSGSQTTLFASLRPLLQPFGFHKQIMVVTLPTNNEALSYLSPLSKNSAAVYDFYLADTFVHAPGDSTFVVEYEPRRGRDFSGLKGVLHIRSGSYAPEYVVAEPADPATLLRFRFEQTYELVQNHWFPAEIRSDWTLQPASLTKLGQLRFSTRSRLTNVRLNQPINPATFTDIAVVLADTANRTDETYWQTHRLDSLTVREKNTFAWHDSLRGWQRFRTRLLPTLAEWGAAGVVPLGRYINLSSQTFFDANVYEGPRLTLNLLTSPTFSRLVRLDGKLAYGFKDQAVKYEGRIRLLLNPARQMFLTGAYRFDVSEPGNVQFFIWNQPQIPYELLRTFLLSRADSLRQWRVDWSFRTMKYATITVSAVQETRQPTYGYRYHAPEWAHMPEQVFSNTELSVGFRYAFNEKLAQIGRGSIVAQAPSPVWSVQVIRGMMSRLFRGDFGYVKLNTRYEQLLRSRRLGETYINLTAGIIWGDLPYPYLYNGRGAKSDLNSIWVANHFQTMGLYEFTSDRYATLFVTHNFKTLLGKPSIPWFRPEPSLVQGVAVGSLRNADWHEGIPIKTMERGFFESGLLVDNLYRQRIANVTYLGVGAGVFYRWGPNQFANQPDNWAYRLVWNIGF